VHGCSVHSLLRKAVNNSQEHETAPLTNKQWTKMQLCFKNMLFVWNSGATFLSHSWWRQNGTMETAGPLSKSTWIMDGCPALHHCCYSMLFLWLIQRSEQRPVLWSGAIQD
jgi:hypothetical protein